MIAGAAALLFVVVYVQTGSSLEHEIDLDLRGDVTQILQSLRSLDGAPAGTIMAEANRYVRAQPYSATSTLLFVLVRGRPPASNHPELFGGHDREGRETAGQQAAENREGLRLAVPKLGYVVRRVPDVGEMRVLERAARIGDVTAVAGAGEPLAGVHAAQRSIARAFVLAGALALLVAVVASYLAGARVTAPLRRMAAVAARVDAGDLEPRMDPISGRAEELTVLAESFNHMLDRLATAFEAHRAFMADASHELRTPLTVMRGQLEVLAATEHPSTEEVRRVERVVQAEITRMSRLVDDLLLLAAAEQSDFLRIESIDLQPFVVDLWDGLTLTANRRFELGPVPDGVLEADPDRVAQAVRNLARNAIDHTRDEDGLVRLEISQVGGGRVSFAVLDDGPGIPAEERERVFERLHRTDASRARGGGGAGLGLAIVRAIAEAHRGSASAAAGKGGCGARVELVLPSFRATGDASSTAHEEAFSPRSGYTT